MKFNGSEDFNFKRNLVWDAMHDPEFLRKVIPGCESLEEDEEGNYLITLRLGVAAIKGEYEGKAQLVDHEPLKNYVLKAEGSGDPGFVKIDMEVTLEGEEEQCTLHYDCDVEVGGLIAGIGGRVLSGVAKFMAKQFFRAVNKELAHYSHSEISGS